MKQIPDRLLYLNFPRHREEGGSVTSVRLGGMIHDFVMLNSLDQTNACLAAMDLLTDWINSKNDTCTVKSK